MRARAKDIIFKFKITRKIVKLFFRKDKNISTYIEYKDLIDEQSKNKKIVENLKKDIEKLNTKNKKINSTCRKLSEEKDKLLNDSKKGIQREKLISKLDFRNKLPSEKELREIIKALYETLHAQSENRTFNLTQATFMLRNFDDYNFFSKENGSIMFEKKINVYENKKELQIENKKDTNENPKKEPLEDALKMDEEELNKFINNFKLSEEKKIEMIASVIDYSKFDLKVLENLIIRFTSEYFSFILNNKNTIKKVDYKHPLTKIYKIKKIKLDDGKIKTELEFKEGGEKLEEENRIFNYEFNKDKIDDTSDDGGVVEDNLSESDGVDESSQQDTPQDTPQDISIEPVEESQKNDEATEENKSDKSIKENEAVEQSNEPEEYFEPINQNIGFVNFFNPDNYLVKENFSKNILDQIIYYFINSKNINKFACFTTDRLDKNNNFTIYVSNLFFLSLVKDFLNNSENYFIIRKGNKEIDYALILQDLLYENIEKMIENKELNFKIFKNSKTSFENIDYLENLAIVDENNTIYRGVYLRFNLKKNFAITLDDIDKITFVEKQNVQNCKSLPNSEKMIDLD